VSLTRRLDDLTPAQEALLPVIRDKWIAIGLSTERADRPRAEAAVRLAYQRAKLSGPARTIWAGSPLAGTATADALIRRASQVRTGTDVRGQVICAVTDQTSNVVARQVSKRVRNDVVNQVASQVAGQVWSPIRHQIDLHIDRPIAGAGYGQHDAHWLAYFDALGLYGLDVSPLDGLMEIAASCGWWWPFEDVCVLSERPSLVARDAGGRLDCSDGPAVAYPDGWAMYAWHGVSVQAATILHPERITVAQIHGEANIEVRRVLLARYGFERYVRDSGALPIHADDTGTLYRCEMAGDEPLVVVSVRNGTREPDGSRKTYILRVPPTTTTARAAIAWTFDQRADEYRPVFET
jgi:hypothetical protein